MTWLSFLLPLLGLGLALAGLRQRRASLRGLTTQLEERERAQASGSHRARLQYPHIDLERCLGCGTCVAACPEEGVLGLIHGQALVVHGARCVGHGRCAEECPTGAIRVALGDLDEREDIPALTDRLEATTVPGLFLAGEVTGYALIRTAVSHGDRVAEEVAARVRAEPRELPRGAYDLCIVGAGPAGLACSLGAKLHDLAFLTLEQGGVGGTVASYPRRKLVMTQPVELPLHGKLSQTTYAKEELMELWTSIIEGLELPIRGPAKLLGIHQRADGLLEVETDGGPVLARFVCLALGRRGTPRKLGVPGEGLPHVAYSLLDAQSYTDRRILVVGGGDSAVEAALGLAEQSGNQVRLSYRRAGFSRLKGRNETRLAQAVEAGQLRLELETEVAEIEPQSVRFAGNGSRDGQAFELPIDDVFVLAGGEPPLELLKRCGISFDPADRPPPADLGQSGQGLERSLWIALGLAVAGALWSLYAGDYYSLALVDRPHSPWHRWLRPAGPFGMTCGLLAVVAMGINLAYLLRRSPNIPLRIGSLRTWMTWHVATGLCAPMLVLLHAALVPRATVGGHAFTALCVLVLTGAVGRFFYSIVPRAANGRELLLDEVRGQLSQLSGELDRAHRGFGDRVHAEVDALVSETRRQHGFIGRLGLLLRSGRRLEHSLQKLRGEAQAADLHPDQVAQVAGLVRRAQKSALAAAHYEDLRGLMASWRFLHRWVALFLVLGILAHVVTALRFTRFFG